MKYINRADSFMLGILFALLVVTYAVKQDEAERKEREVERCMPEPP